MRIAVGLLCCVVGGQAWAQTSLPTSGLDRLVLTPGSGPVVGGDAATLEQGRFRVALAANYERNPLLLTITNADGTTTRKQIVGNRLQLNLLGAVGLFDWLDLQLQVPLTVFQRGDTLQDVGLTQPQSFGVGSPVIGLRAGILRQKSAPLDLAIQLAVALPLGTPGALTGGRFSVLPSIHAGRSFGNLVHLALSFGAAIEARKAVGASAVGSLLELNGLLGIGDTIRGELISHNQFSVAGAGPTSELLIGGRILAPFPVDFFLHGGPTFGTAPGAPTFRVIGGIGVGTAYKKAVVDPCTLATHTPEQCPALDDDGDGVVNGRDTCPTDPEDRDGFQDEDGCPELDNDKDGIPDAQDKCRDVAGVFAFEGCPVPDADHDGVMDADDQCPTEPGPANRQGCPFRDQDNDGVEDSHDKCPAEAGLLELKGCPAKDTDGDSVADHLDNCPAEKGVPENQGCPKKKQQLVVITRDRLVIKDKVYFATGKSKILPKSFPLLNQVADVINGHPEIARVVVEGHTDSVGKPETNRKLSQDRANAVMTYLLGRKVDASRLSARGYGPDKPAATNDTAAGREQNRRVEFTLPGADEGGAP